MAPRTASAPRAGATAALAMLLGCAPAARAITSDTLQFAPPLAAAEAQATQLQASLVWKEVSPENRDAYMAISVALGDGLPAKNGAVGTCNSGYMGGQLHSDGNHTLLWSMSGREEGQIVPVGEYCHYDCFDCSPPNRRDFQCKRDDYKIRFDVNYAFILQMEMQNASGAMWSVTVVDPTAGWADYPIEVGRVFFKDREFGLPEDNCRVLGVDTYLFQEYWNPNQQDHTTRASWSAITFSGAMKPQDNGGFCQGGAPASLAEFDSGFTGGSSLTMADCKGRCAAEERCHFASFSDAPVDTDYGRVPGSHCMLFDRCEARDAPLPEIWWTFEKVDAPTLVAQSFTEMCQKFQDQNCDWRFAAAAVHRLPGGPVEFEFDVGEDVRCVEGMDPEVIESLGGRCPAPGVSHLAKLAAPALRGSAQGAPAGITAPHAVVAQHEGVPVFP